MLLRTGTVRICLGSADFQSVVFGRRFAMNAQPHFLSLSSSQKEERAGERRRFLSISPLSGSLPARSSQGERAKMPQAFACRTRLISNLPYRAVSPNCIRQGAGPIRRVGVFQRLAECNSAIQRSAAKPQPMERGSVTSVTSRVRQKICFERNRVFSPSPPQKGGEAGERRRFLSISPSLRLSPHSCLARRESQKAASVRRAEHSGSVTRRCFAGRQVF